MSMAGDEYRGRAQTLEYDAFGTDMNVGVGSDHAYQTRNSAHHQRMIADHEDEMDRLAKKGVFVESGGSTGDSILGNLAAIVGVLGLIGYLLYSLVYSLFQFGNDLVTLPVHEALYKVNPSWGRNYYNSHVSKPWEQWKLSDNPNYDRDAIAGRNLRARNTPSYASAGITYYYVFPRPPTSADLADIAAYRKRRDKASDEAHYFTGALALDCIRKAYDRCMPIKDYPNANYGVVTHAAEYLRQLAEKGDVQAAYDLGIIYLQPAERGAFYPKEAIESFRWAAQKFSENKDEFSRRASVVEQHAKIMLLKSK